VISGTVLLLVVNHAELLQETLVNTTEVVDVSNLLLGWKSMMRALVVVRKSLQSMRNFERKYINVCDRPIEYFEPKYTKLQRSEIVIRSFILYHSYDGTGNVIRS
jgi:hypothetical protein